MTGIKYLIFDLDGTLIDSSRGVVEAVNYSLRQMGQPPQPAEAIRPFIGYSLCLMYPHFTDVPYSELLAHFRVKAAETIVVSTEMLPGVGETLKALHATGYPMAIATTKIRPNVEGILDKLNWRHLFAAYVTGDEVRQVKPDPDALHLALKRLGAQPDGAIMIGDTINDVLAAKAVPMPVVAIASPFSEERQKVIAAAPDFFIESITELPGLLDEYNYRFEGK